MDPNETLRRIRELAQRLAHAEDFEALDAVDLAEHVEALDEWIGKGGFLPADWQKH